MSFKSLIKSYFPTLKSSGQILTNLIPIRGRQWGEFQSFDIKWSSLTLTKIHRFYFKDIRFSIKLWGQSFKYLTSISQSGNCLVNCHGDQSYSWFSATNWLSRALIGQFIFETATPGTSVMVEVAKIHLFFNQRFHLKAHRNQW